MYKIYILLVLLLGVLPAEASEINFLNVSIEKGKALAAREGKLLLVEFVAGWSQPCNKMNETTHKDNSVANLANNNYIALKVDVDGFEGVRYKKQYSVKLLPTILIFSSKGKQLARYEGYIDAKAMYAALKKYNLPQFKPRTISKEQVTQKSSTPTAYEQSSQRLTPSKTNQFDGVYKWNVSKIASSGFAIQVGAFQSYESVLSETSNIQQQHSVPVLVAVGTKGNQSIYRVLLGPFNAKGEAQSYLNRMKRRGQTGIVKDLASLNVN